MNRVFRIIWSRALRTWVVVSELATRCGKDGGGLDRRARLDGFAHDHVAAGPASPWPLRVGIMAALLALHAPARAVDRYWDVNGTGIGNGGTGTWNTTSAFWSPNNDGVSGPYSAWNNAALYDAFFGGTAGTVTLSGAITAHNLTFQTNGYSLTGGSLTLGGTSPTIEVTAGTTTIASPITSTGAWVKAGAGALTLNGSNTFGGGFDITGGTLTLNAANSFTGNINVTGGNLSIGAIGNAALGDVANQINLAGGRFSSAGTISNRTVNLTGGMAFISGGVGSLFYTGTGGLNVADGVALTNNANNYQGQTQFITGVPSWGGSAGSFSSIADLGVASALGAPTTVANGTIMFGPGCCQALGASALSYTGTGNSSNRNWQFRPGNYSGGAYLYNRGSGTLTLTGDVAAVGGSQPFGFGAVSADMNVLGVISSNTGRTAVFSADSGRTIRLGTANTFTGAASIGGAGKVEASVIANAGVAGSVGMGSVFINGGTLSYVGAGESTTKNWSISNGSLNSDGTGALTVSGTVAIGGTASLGGSFTGADNVISGVVSGTGSLRSAGNATWTLTGTNTYTGSTIVNSGVLRAGTANAFGASTAAQVNGGTLDLNDFDRTFTTLTGTGGTVDLGTATLTLQAAAGTTATYAGNIAGSGGLTKLGASTQTLTGTNTYTGNTTVGGGVLALDFSSAGGPASDIINSQSTLDMAGGRLNVIGAAGENNTQTFDGVNVTASNNTIDAKAGTGGSLTVNLGAINRTGGLMNFNLPVNGNITTTNTALGGWATVNGTDYAKVESGNIVAFEEADYTDKDNAANWLANEFITDVDGFFGAVNGSVQLGGLRYTVPVSTTVTIAPGETLGVDGTIIVAPTVLNTNQTITGGNLTGANGGDLGIQQNSTGNFTIASQIVDNGPGMGFVKAGTGLVTLGSASNSYTGATRIAQGTLAVSSISDGGVASGIGASSAASSNLSLEGATLRYTGAGDTSDRGFTFARSGAIVESGVEVSNAGANLTFTGLVTSPDAANFLKSGPGTLTLANPANAFTGIVTVTGGLLGATTLANGGQASSIGAGGSGSANLVLNGGGLQYTGATTSTNRGFTLGASGGIVDVTAAPTTLTDSGIVAGGGRLTKNGAGTLVLTGVNTYTGGNTVNAGILRAGAANVLGALTASPTNLADTAGVLLDLNNFNNVIGPLNGGGANGGNVTLGSGTLRIAAGNGNYSGVISGTGGVWRTDGGVQTFNGCNHTYTGATTLQGSDLSVDCLADGGLASGIGASSAASSSLVFNNGSLRYTGGSIAIDRGFQLLAAGGIHVTNAGTTLEFEGNVIGAGTLVKREAGTLVLSGTNTSTGNTLVEGGTLRAATTNAFGPQGHMTLNNTAGVLLDLDGFNTVVTSLIGGGANGGNIVLDGATLTILDGANQTFAGVISGAGNLVKSGGGLQALTNCNNSYGGATTISAGTLQVSCLDNGGVASSIGTSSSAPSNLAINGTLRYVGAGSSTDRQFTLGTSGGTLDASGTGIVEFTSTSATTLAGANTARTLTLTGTNTGYNLFAGQLDNNGAGLTSLTKTGTGTWRLTNANSTYTGVTRINGGVLSVDQLANGGVASSIGASSSAAGNLVIGNGSTLRYTGAGDTTDRQFTLDTGVTFIESSGTGALQFTNIGAVALTGTNTARTIALGGTNTGANTLGGTIGDNGTGATTLAKNDSGTWILTGNNTYTGNTVINNGNLMIGNGGTTGNAGAGNVIVDSATSTLSINRSDAFNFNGTLSGPGTLAQIGTGTTVLTSTGNSIGATTISAGTLDVDGALTTPTIAMSGASTLTVDGTVQASGPTQTALTGDAGASTVNVNAGGTLRANGDLGDGSDALNVTGTLDTGAATLNLGAADDTLTLHDGAVIAGTGIDAGGGTTDNLIVDNAASYIYDGTGIAGFERLTKRNTGVLTTTGTQAFSAGTAIEAGTLDVDGTLVTPNVAMSDSTTLSVDGTVEGAGSTTATLTGSAGLNAIEVNAGAMLRASGDLADGNDTIVVSGTLDTGAGALSLGAGDDSLTLRDGAVLAGTGITAGAGGNDQLQLDNATALAFDGGQTAGFERLLKTSAGTATMTGSQAFTAGTMIGAGTLDVDGTLETPAIMLADGTLLNVDGTVGAAGATQSLIVGSVGDNTVAVGVGGTLRANGDLGNGNDVLDVAGTLDTGAGILALGDGDDTLTIHENTNIVGTVSAGAGNDTFDTHIDTVADLGAVQGFETLAKTGTGTLNINGPLPSDFTAVAVQQGTLNVTAAGDVVAAPGSSLITTVASGATLNVDGSYGCGAGSDSMTVAGTVSGTGTIDLCGGDDTLTLQDGAAINNAISGGAGGSDTLVLDSAAALAFDGGNTDGFERLRKDNVGTATVTGTQTFVDGTTITAGTLDIDGTLETPTIDLADATVLNVDGTVQAVGPAAATITGSAGTNTVVVGATGVLRAAGDLGDGQDTLDVAGTLDTNGGVLQLGDGDDNFVVHDGTLVLGTVDGGAGLDTRTYDIDTTASFGALANFEGVTKSGTGVLNVAGPGTTDLQQVVVLEGTLDVAAGASIVATAGSPLTTLVASGATLNVDGDYGCGAGNDSLTVSGTLSGSGNVALCDGDDVLTLNDGADLNGLANAIDAGAGAADTVVLNNASALALDSGNVANFEALRKDNTGEATLTGDHGYTSGVLLNAGTLTVAGTLTTPAVAMGDDTVLNVNTQLESVGGTAAAIIGSAGANTVNVAAGALLIANGDLGDGADVLSVAGTLDSDGGVFSLGAGDDTFMVFDTTDTSNAVIDGGLGNDLLDVDVGAGNTVPLGGLLGFESLGKSGQGTLEIHGASSFIDVDLDEGTLRVTGTGSVGATDTTILSGATLELADAGSYGGTSGADRFTVAGTIVATGTQAGTLDLGDGDDVFTIQDGANLSGLTSSIAGGAGTDTFVADLAGDATLGGAVGFETLTKTNVGTLNVDGPAASAFTTVNVDGGTLDVGVAGRIDGVQSATVASGASLVVDGAFSFTAGADTFTVAGNVSGTSTLNMLDGDDTLTVQDGADLSGLATSLDGGSGNDTLNTDIATTATLGGVTGFETLDKTNTGTLIVAGPAPSDFTTVNVDGGTLDVGVNGNISGVVTSTIANGATLNVDGDYGGSSGADTMTVSGAITGTSTIAFLEGDDTLTLNDGADLSGFTGTLDGGDPTASDYVVLNNAAALTFGAGSIINFEYLTKTNTGTATLLGAQAYSGGVDVAGGTLVVTGDLLTPTMAMSDDTALTVIGTLGAAGSTATAITGSAGVNAVTIAGTALATGDLGAGEDVLDVTGTLDTAGGVFALGEGDDNFIVHDGTAVLGTVDGGAGLDTRTYDINLAADLGALVNFEGVTKTGTGVLNVVGPATTALQDVQVLGGTLNIGAAGSVTAIAGGPLDTLVATGATLNVEGSYGCGASDDRMAVSGTVSGSGTIDMCGGEDTLTLNDGALLANVVSGGAHGTGDTVVLNNASALTFDAGNTINFEYLRKDNTGEATLTGTQAFSGGTMLDAGTLLVAGVLETPTLTLADATVLNVDGTVQASGGGTARLTGSAGANTVNVAGVLRATADLGAGDDTVRIEGRLDTAGGLFALGEGDDSATFIRSDASGVAQLDGGTGTDRLGFVDSDLAGERLPTLSAWERIELRENSTLDLGSRLELGSGVLAIDATSGLLARNGAAIGGSVENAGRIDAGANRLSIGGGYAGQGGLLNIAVSPSTLSAGGLDIGGDVTGDTRVQFTGDGSDVDGSGTVSILVISSPNDDAATAGSFVPAGSVDGTVRLGDSIFPWTFAQGADRNWYLNAEAGLLPEIPGYAVLPSLGVLMAQNNDNLVHQRLAGVRGSELPQCGTEPNWPTERAGTGIIDDCRGFWAAATASELELGANPGFEVSGDDVGLYIGADSAFDRPGRTLRGGFYLGYRHGNYWTTGANSTGLPGIGQANVDLDTVVGGMYMSHDWTSGTYLNLVLSGQRPRAYINAEDSFSQRVTGNSLTLSSRVGHRFSFGDGWTVEPQLQLAASAVGWAGFVDEAGKEVAFDDDVIGTARAAVRFEKRIVGDSGATWRPWATVGVQSVVGDKDGSMGLAQAGALQGLPSHDLGTSATLDVGLEATLNQRVSLFGALSVGNELEGTDHEQREANLGVRVRW